MQGIHRHKSSNNALFNSMSQHVLQAVDSQRNNAVSECFLCSMIEKAIIRSKFSYFILKNYDAFVSLLSMFCFFLQLPVSPTWARTRPNSEDHDLVT